MKNSDSEGQVIFKTGTSISSSSAWFVSLVRNLRENFAERRNPTPRAEITAASDPSGLKVLVDRPSQMASLWATIKSVVDEKRHPRHIEMTATPLDVEELWSKPKYELPGVLSLLAHVGVVGGLIYVSIAAHAAVAQPPKIVETSVLLEPLNVPLLPAAAKAGGGGGGGKHMLTPASKGVLPKGDTVQFVPPTAIPTTATAEIMIEPTLIGNMVRTDFLSPIGLPTGVLGPPSDGKGKGGGIGDNGDGHGIGDGKGPGAGEGCCGGSGGGDPVYKVGNGAGGASAPSCQTVEPNYSDDARKARVQGTVVLNSIVQKDGVIDVVGLERGLGYGLDEEAKRVLKKWKCNPGKKDGQSVAVQLQIVINFRLF